MNARRLVATGFRNLARVELALPAEGAILLGPNGQGKTNFLEALYYPVLFRSFRGARDRDLVRHGDSAFHLALSVDREGEERCVEAGFELTRRKRIAVDGVLPDRLTDALGVWLAVAFQPSDLTLIAGGAGERRTFLDRTLSLSDRDYLSALRRYRNAVVQRNAALRQGARDAALAYEPTLAKYGAAVITRRLQWVARYGPLWAEICAELGERHPMSLGYRGHRELADPASWPGFLEARRARDLARGSTGVGPHRDDLGFDFGGTALRIAGSTGQQRTAAIALKLCERHTVEDAHGRPAALLLDDVFAELDRERQNRLAEKLGLHGGRQVFITTPRRDELPDRLELPIFSVATGIVQSIRGLEAA